MPDGREQVRQAYLKLLASIERAIQQLQDRASHPHYRYPHVYPGGQKSDICWPAEGEIELHARTTPAQRKIVISWQGARWT